MKKCPYCAEEIQEQAIKCRHCSMMLNAPEVAPLPAALAAASSGGGKNSGDLRVLYDGVPSWRAEFWPFTGAVATVATGLFGIVLSLVKGWGKYGALAAAIVGVTGVVWFLILHLKQRSTHVRITSSTIDIESGIVSKSINTIQLWRVRDIDFSQSIIERILGISSIHILSSDADQPNLVLKGIPDGKTLFKDLRDQVSVTRQGRNIMGVVE